MYGIRTPSIGITNAVKKKIRVSGVLRAISVQNAANPRSDATGEMRIAAISVPSTSASTPETASSRRVTLKPSQNSGISDQSCSIGPPFGRLWVEGGPGRSRDPGHRFDQYRSTAGGSTNSSTVPAVEFHASS